MKDIDVITRDETNATLTSHSEKNTYVCKPTIFFNVYKKKSNDRNDTSMCMAFPIFQNSMQQPTPELARIIHEVSLSSR
jgi:hypothetical protein